MTDPKLTLHFVEEMMYDPMAQTHRGGRIEIWESDKEHHTEEIRILLPRRMYERLREKLEGMEL